MKIGLITDIHEHVEHLQTALDLFETEHVDQVVVIGDVFEMGKRIEETCRLLSDAKAVGVWGNHDYGLSVEPVAVDCAKYGDIVVRFMTSLRPRLRIEDCYFAHVEPWLNPEDVGDLWYFDGPPDQHGNLDRIFNAAVCRLSFAGHFHKWLLATPDRVEEWKGEKPIKLAEGRYFVVIGALCEGRFALFDTETSELIPFNEQSM